MADAPSELDQLKKSTIVVADTGDFDAMKAYAVQDATTNPSLLLKAVQIEKYKGFIDKAVAYGLKQGGTENEQLLAAWDKLAVYFGLEILKIVPGLVSTELDARLSYDVKGSVERARKIIKMYEEEGIKKERILIKIASTWEGLEACRQLEKEGIHCNMTLLFSIYQAARAAEVGATLISPFVGRITDWYKKAKGVDSFPVEEDPGVKSVRSIYRYYKNYGYKTVVMGASFRSKEQVTALNGCDKLTVGPKWLEAMKNSTDKIAVALTPEQKSEYGGKLDTSESSFRWGMCNDAMATEKLAEGIRKFAVDVVKLEKMIMEKMQKEA